MHGRSDKKKKLENLPARKPKEWAPYPMFDQLLILAKHVRMKKIMTSKLDLLELLSHTIHCYYEI